VSRFETVCVLVLAAIGVWQVRTWLLIAVSEINEWLTMRMLMRRYRYIQDERRETGDVTGRGESTK
jgi:hypothetical protein